MKKEVKDGIFIMEGEDIEKFEEEERIVEVVLIGEHGKHNTIYLGDDVTEENAYEVKRNENKQL